MEQSLIKPKNLKFFNNKFYKITNENKKYEKKLEKFFSKIQYPLKKVYSPIIPLNIFQTWHTKNLPDKMKICVNYLKTNNPVFAHYLFDDEDCRNFIKNNYDNTVLNAFDKLIPGAYKADLWRYCVLYKLGGIYIDIKYMPINNFKLINLTESEHFVLDADRNGIFNAFLACSPGNKKLLLAINKIVENVNVKFYGNCPLEPTGPKLLATFFSLEEKKNLDMYHEYFLNNENKFIFYKNFTIFKNYNDYKKEQNTFQKNPHYSILWSSRNIYK